MRPIMREMMGMMVRNVTTALDSRPLGEGAGDLDGRGGAFSKALWASLDL